MSFSIYKPEVFQGSLKNKRYFEGWYFKHVSSDLKHVWSFIPGISINDNEPHSFIQVINGITGKSEYISYPVESFIWDKQKVFIKIGDSVFTDSYIDLKIKSGSINIEGHIDFINCVNYPKTLFSPGIMGWYSFVPYMECKHGIISVNHSLKGSISAEDTVIDFTGGKGYIEKDWGTSFPEAWIWMQSNNFSNSGTSFTFSVAKIPWIGKFFIGFISFLFYNREFIVFSTYNKSSLTDLVHDENSVSMTLRNKKFILKVRAVKKTFGELKAPASGNMSRRIKESVDSDLTLTLYDLNNNILYSDTGKRAGLEVIDKIFEYL
ncbi:MAG: hypothetical protein IPH69_10755 [Bacteroidales bacterium]|nr:hypothetical protein [Bacteroidales bacterium]